MEIGLGAGGLCVLRSGSYKFIRAYIMAVGMGANTDIAVFGDLKTRVLTRTSLISHSQAVDRQE